MNTSFFKLDVIIRCIGLIGVSLFFLLSIMFNKGHRLGVILLAISSVIYCLKKIIKRESFYLRNSDKKYILVIFSYSIVIFFINFYHSNELRYYEYAAKFLLGIPFFLFFTRNKLKIVHLFVLLGLGVTYGSVLGLYNFFNFSWAYRATIEGLNTIHYASLVQIFSFINIVGLQFSKKIKNKGYRYLYVTLVILAFILGLSLSVLTYTRGVWIALPIQLLIVSLFFIRYNKNYTLGFTITLLLFITTIFFVPQTGVKKRLLKVKKNLTSYKLGKKGSSSGLRLEMYRFAVELAKDKPILGTPVKEAKFKQNKHLLIKHLVHYHNHFFQYLAHYGLFGVFILFMLYYRSFKSMLKKYKSRSIEEHAYGTIGLTLICSYFVYSLTDVFFLSDKGLFLFIIMMGICYNWGELKKNN